MGSGVLGSSRERLAHDRLDDGLEHRAIGVADAPEDRQVHEADDPFGRCVDREAVEEVVADVAAGVVGPGDVHPGERELAIDRVDGEPARKLVGAAFADRIAVEHQAYACMLGGSDRRTLYLCTAETYDPAKTVANTGRIEAAEVDVPGAGLP